MMASAVLELKGIDRHYLQGPKRLTILSGADLTLAAGEMVALVAPSGAGKSTLLHIAGLLERPDAGEVIVNGQACGRLSDDKRTAIRRNEIGFVYQFHHLLPEFTALENVMIPQLVAGLKDFEAQERGEQLLDYMKIGKRADHRPAELSGGEQQRVAIARALANEPSIILADEPTGNLDVKNSTMVFDLLTRLAKENGQAVILVTHNPDIANRCDFVRPMRDGLFV